MVYLRISLNFYQQYPVRDLTSKPNVNDLFPYFRRNGFEKHCQSSACGEQNLETFVLGSYHID